MSDSVFPHLPKSGVTFPESDLLKSALEYAKKHTSPSILNHCLRSAAFALLLAPRLEQIKGTQPDLDLVVYACIMHDLGLATTEGLRSGDKRFEVDGANLGRQFLLNQGHDVWGARQMQLVWDAIALHTTGSIAQHKEPEVALVAFGISADFAGPNLPPQGIISIAEYEEIVMAFPRLGFKDSIVEAICGLCRDKPDTTFDNVAGEFGRNFGYDGHGHGKEDYHQKWAEGALVRSGVRLLEACATIEHDLQSKESKAETHGPDSKP
jgi:hypothetical protein